MTDRLLVNFGGPRNLDEVKPFLRELLCDRDVIQTKFPKILHNFLFGRIAAKRAEKIKEDYHLIGGKSPIYFDTEELGKKLGAMTFHRYLPATHEASLEAIERCEADEIRVLPLFPQFTFATTGSIARFFEMRLSKKAKAKLRWIPSYPDHPGFVYSFQEKIRSFLKEMGLREDETILLYSAHGVPLKFILEKDPYQEECERSFHSISAGFPLALNQLAYQSKFGRGEWLRPYTIEMCESVLSWHGNRKNLVFVPLAFTSDHIETLFEIEYQYLPIIREKGLAAYRCPALNFDAAWIEALRKIFDTGPYRSNRELIRLRSNSLLSILSS